MRHLILVLGTAAIAAVGVGCGDDSGGTGSGSGGAGGAGATGTTTTQTTGTGPSTTTTTAGPGTGGSTGTDTTTATGTGGETSTSTGEGGGTGGSGTGGADLVSPACEEAPLPAPSEGACIAIGGTVECNPITNEGCEEGELCDVIDVDTFICFPPGDAVACEFCDFDTTFCAPGLSCTTYWSAFNQTTVQACAQYCCDDSDCPDGTVCQSAEQPGSPQLGLCLETALD